MADDLKEQPAADAVASAAAVAAALPPQSVSQMSSPKYTLSFENLSVHVPGTKSSSKLGRVLLRPFQYVAVEYLGLSTLDRSPFTALSNITGYVNSGELCLVLGSNDEAKSTLLRALSGRLSCQDEQSGTLAFNGHALLLGRSNSNTTAINRGWKRMCPYVSPGDIDHAPVLTVRETLDFARRCATAAPTTTTKASATDNITQGVTKLLTTLGLEHVADTIVGDENIRGISGGQKRRVTVGEMLSPHCSFICMENITDGLSSTDSVKLITDLANVSLYCVCILFVCFC
jgi:ABC-type multidrug transport system ATPase subunit